MILKLVTKVRTWELLVTAWIQSVVAGVFSVLQALSVTRTLEVPHHVTQGTQILASKGAKFVCHAFIL